MALLLFTACGSGGSGNPGTIGNKSSWGDPPAGGAASQDPSYRPKGLELRTFTSAGVAYAPIDIETQELTLTFDRAKQTVTGRASLKFTVQARGKPYLLLDGTVKSAEVDGTSISTRSVETPAGEPVLVFDRMMDDGQSAELELSFTLPSSRFTWSSDGVGFITDMSDIGVRFLERYGPANYEDDSFALTMTLKIEGSSISEHSLFANGDITAVGEGEWKIRFAKHYTSSSFYTHLTNRPLHVRNFEVKGAERMIPVTIYSSEESRATEGAKRMQSLIEGLEADFGPYPHPGFIAYISKSSGGMEYVGATITSLSALSHELFHSYFARGVMPAEGRSGWIDEGLASWRDRGYPRATSLLERTPTNFDSPSVFERNTTSRAYSEGRSFMAEMDLKFADIGGFRPVIRRIFEHYRLALMTSEEFEAAIEEATARDVSSYFDRYVSGDSVSSPVEIDDDPAHPTPLTEEEVRDLR